MAPLAANTTSARADDSLAEMMRERDAARSAWTGLRHDLGAVGRLYGTALQLELNARVEVAADRYEDALHTASRAMAAADERTASAQRQATTMAARVSVLHDVVINAALEVQRRYGVARNPVPDELLALIEAGGEAWAFVYPPADERHEHDATNGGECRHPLCPHRAALVDEEPF